LPQNHSNGIHYYSANYLFSFAGLKTSALYWLRDNKLDDKITASDFCASFEQSIVDGKQAIIIDYGVKRNPWFARPIRDELREVAPKIYLALCVYRYFGKQPILGWFAVDCTGSHNLMHEMMVDLVQS
jgi:hypothetical protein